MNCRSAITTVQNTLIFILILAGAVAKAQTVPAYLPTNGLQCWYPFNGNADNEFGTGKNGVVLGPVLATDRFGTPNAAYHFNGDGDHINLDTTFFNVGWSSYSITCWINSDTLFDPYASSNNQAFLNTEPHNGLELSVNYGSNGKYTFLANSNPPVFGWDILSLDTSHAALAIHTWNQVAFTKKNDTTYQFYLNGLLDKTFNRSTVAVTYYCKIILGRIDTIHPNEGFMGTLDDYGIWDRELAGCEIRRLYNSSAFTYITAQPTNASSYPSATVHFSVTDTGVGDTYQWQLNSGSGFADLTATAPYSGVTTAMLTIAGVTSAMSSYSYRCVVSGASPCVDTSDAGILTVVTTGVNQVNSGPGISIVPNPTNGVITINGAGYAGIKVYSIAGQLMKEAYNAEEISIADLPAGMYLIKLLDKQGSVVYFDKVVKQ